MDLRSNILNVFGRATDDDISKGMSWYDDAHTFATTLDHNVSRAAGIIAALSPMNGWANNKAKAELLYSQNGEGTNVGLFSNVAKAQAIYNGADPLTVLGGDKVRAFYATILDPSGDHNPVIDRHAFDIAVGQVTNSRERGKLSRKGEYTRFAQAYRQAAISEAIGASQLQAITWLTWRRELGKAWLG
jgi:hypothetical protein